jgi:membrane fusion protein (multidrug efflux system)
VTRRSKFSLLAGLVVLAAAAGLWFWLDRQDAEAPTAARPPAQVVVAEATTTRIVRRLQSVGTLRATESVLITAETTGRLVEVLFEDGARVAAGDLLFRLEEDALRAELRAAEAEVMELRQQLDRASRLARGGYGPRAEAEDLRPRLQAAEARAALATTRLDQLSITAPFDGRLGLRRVSPGALVEPGTPLVPLDAVDPIELRFALPEREIGRVAAGAPVRAMGAALAEDEWIEGEVRVVAPRVDPALRTVEVVARLPNPEGRLVPGMLMQVMVGTEVVEAAVVVPPIAVQPEGPRHFVFRVRGNRVERVEVQLGSRTPDRIEILAGVEPGDLLVVEGMDLTDGQEVAPRRAGAAVGIAAADGPPP